jgi:hypothetical protein
MSKNTPSILLPIYYFFVLHSKAAENSIKKSKYYKRFLFTLSCPKDGRSDCLESQTVFGAHGALSLMIALRIVRSFLATAMAASIFGFPAWMRR